MYKFQTIDREPERKPRRFYGRPCSKVALDFCKVRVVSSILMLSKSSSRIKPWGRRRSLDLRSGRFESFILEIIYCVIAQLVERSSVKRVVLGSSPSSTGLLSSRLTGRTTHFECVNRSSNLRRSGLWPSYRSLILPVVIWDTGVRIPLATPSAIRKIGKSNRLRPGSLSVRV